MTAAYMFARILVDDFEAYFEQYGAPFMEVLTKYEGELLVATKDGEVLEGNARGNWTVLAKFPSVDAARAFYESEAYAPLKALRIDKLTSGSEVILFPDQSGQ